MSKLIQWLKAACYSSGLQADIDYQVSLGDGVILSALARVRYVGAPNGMLIFRSFVEVEGFLEKLSQAEYGFSVLEEPLPDEEFDLEAFREMFLDWGWASTSVAKPAWWS